MNMPYYPHMENASAVRVLRAPRIMGPHVKISLHLESRQWCRHLMGCSSVAVLKHRVTGACLRHARLEMSTSSCFMHSALLEI